MCMYVGAHEYVCYDHMAEVRGQLIPFVYHVDPRDQARYLYPWSHLTDPRLPRAHRRASCILGRHAVPLSSFLSPEFIF